MKQHGKSHIAIAWPVPDLEIFTGLMCIALPAPSAKAEVSHLKRTSESCKQSEEKQPKARSREKSWVNSCWTLEEQLQVVLAAGKRGAQLEGGCG